MRKRRILAGLLAVVLGASAIGLTSYGLASEEGTEQGKDGAPGVQTEDILPQEEKGPEEGQPQDSAVPQERTGPPRAASFDELKAAILNAPSGRTTIAIAGDFTITEAIAVQAGQDIVLVDDGTKRTVSVDDALNHSVFLIEQGGHLSITTSRKDDTLLCFDGKGAVRGGRDGEAAFIHCGGEFTLLSGTIRNMGSKTFLGGIIVVDGKGARMQMDGGVLEENLFTFQSGGVVKVSHGGSFTMNGGSISRNETKPGGEINSAAVYVTAEGNSTFVMNGGSISDNHGDYGGVMVGEPAYPVIQPGVIATMTMNGGSISGNVADRYGGGIMVCGQATVTINGGTISKNQALTGGGIAAYDLYHSMGIGQDHNNWKRFFPAELIVDGGTISENQAIYRKDIQDGGCGGGVYIATDCAVIKSGKIFGNTAQRQSGGVYVGSTPYVLRIYDAVVRSNTASILGGGLWFCPTGDATNAVTNGGAIFENTAEGAGDDFVAVPQTDKKHTVTLADRVLGGGQVKWYRDGGVLSTTPEAGNVLGTPDGTARYDEADPGEPMENIKLNSEGIALKAILSDSAKELAGASAKVEIRGNKAPRGGGIGSNGGVVIGTPGDEWTLNVAKVWDGIPEGEYRDKKLQVCLTIGSYQLDEVVLCAENGWTAAFTQLPDPASLGGLTVGVVEKGDAYQVGYSELKWDRENRQLSIVITNAPKPEEPEPPKEPDPPEEPDLPEEPLPPEDSVPPGKGTDTPRTSDDTRIEDWSSALAVSAMALIALAERRKGRETR